MWIYILILAIGWWILRRSKNVNLQQFFQGKKVIITGGGSGIGKELAMQLCKLGANVCITGRRIERLEEVAKLSKKEGGQCITVQGDCSEQGDCKEIVEKTVKAFGGVDILILNHAWGRIQKFEDIPEDEFVQAYHDTFDANVLGSMLMIKYALPHIKKSKGGILFNSTMSVFYGIPKLGLYSSSKLAMHSILDCISAELPANSGIAITVVCPGLIETEHAGAHVPASDMQRAMKVSVCAKQFLDGIAQKKRHINMNLVASPPVSGELVYLLAVLFPSLTEWLLRKTYSFRKEGEDILDVVEEKPIISRK